MKDTTSIGEGKIFSPGNLRATFDNPDYDKVIIAFASLRSCKNSVELEVCVPAVDQLLREGEVHAAVHRRNGAWCQPGNVMHTETTRRAQDITEAYDQAPCVHV